MPIKGATSVGLDRRQLLAGLAVGSGVAVLSRLAADGGPPARRSKMGLAGDCWNVHQRAQVGKGQKGDLSDPRLFLERCYQLGAGGMQMSLGVRDEAYCTGLRRWAEDHEMYVEGSTSLAGSRFDAERFEKEVVTAKAAGATVVRTVVIPGRRYEQFRSAEEFAGASQQAAQRLRQVEPIMMRHRMRLAVENHKCHRVAERLDLLKQLGSEWIGMCVDTGNSFALCEDPMEVVRAYAPFAFSVHVRDQGVQEYEDGFLFTDLALGQGFLDVPTTVRVLREARPELRFSLEMIARDPLKVPVLTSKYWATMPDVPAANLAWTLRTVKAQMPRAPLPTIDSLPLEQRVQYEQRMVEDSLAYAREHLGL
ncbi:MAG: sugar phosphate isomerase/epimerase [Planctomycetes bacterium]|nr:sugar phosphate isomerase/epimerase [Planctomycetota bacterium]